MCCLFTTLVLAGPRAAMIIWWLMDPVRWELAFNSFLVPLFGFLLFPITTLTYVLVFPGGVDGLDILWMGIAVALDLSSAFGGAYGNKDRVQGAY
jgi:hypothetical protein